MTIVWDIQQQGVWGTTLPEAEAFDFHDVCQSSPESIYW